jgi:hypothetical protein
MPRGKKKQQDQDQATAPGLGHNTEMTDADKAVLWFALKRDIITFDGQIASITGKLRDKYKKAKAALGLTRAEVRFGISLADDDGEVKASAQRQLDLLRWEEHPLGLQSSLFDIIDDDGIDRTPAVDKKRAQGLRDGQAGADMNPDCDPSTPQFQAYNEGFHEGNADRIRSKIKPLEAGAVQKLAEDEEMYPSEPADELTDAAIAAGLQERPWPDDEQTRPEHG